MNYSLCDKLSRFWKRPGNFSRRSVFFSIAVTLFTGIASLWPREAISGTVTVALHNVSEKQGSEVPGNTVQADKENWRRDPFLLPAEKRPGQYIPGLSSGKSAGQAFLQDRSLDAIRLQGIMQVETKQYALINGRVYGVGDRVSEGLVIKEIGQYHIVVKLNGLQQTFNIFQGKLK